MNKIKIGLIAALCVANSFAEVINLEPVSVTATKSEEKVIDQPLSISTKGEEEIELDQVIVQKDLLNSIVGVQIEQTGSVIGHTTAIRMPENKSSYYLFMQDGIPVQSSGFFNHNGLAYTTFQSATSVEVLKGAGTALYGSDAVAAVIDVQSLKKPSKEKEITLKGMAGSYGYGSGSVEMSDTIDEKSAYRASVGYMHSDGWREHTKTDRIEANLRYDHLINDENDLKIIFNTSKTDAEQADTFSDYANIESGSKDASDDSNYYDALDATDIKRKFDYARLSAEWTNYSFSNLEIALTPYVRYNRNRYVATWEKNYPSSDNEIMTIGLMEKNTYDASWGRLITGFDTEYTQSSLNYAQDFDITTTGFGSAAFTTGKIYDYDVNYLAVAPYIHTEYDITEAIILTAGLRYDYNHYDYENNLADGDASDISTPDVYYRPADRTDSFSHLSPKLSLQYQADKDTNIYARYANGFRIPQASTLYSMKSGYSEVTLDPEISDTYEVGVKKLFAEKSFIELSLYYMTVDDTITSYRVGGTRYYDNGGETTHKGIEATVNTQITNEWATHIAYSFSKHNYVNDPSYNDNEIAQAPNHLANTRLIYTPTAIKGLRIMGEWQYVGSYWMNDDHETTATKTSKYGGYSIGNLKADYRYSKNISVFGKINNITDEEYATSASSKYSNSYSPGNPREFFAGLEYRW